jgi:hypothetical protein
MAWPDRGDVSGVVWSSLVDSAVGPVGQSTQGIYPSRWVYNASSRRALGVSGLLWNAFASADGPKTLSAPRRPRLQRSPAESDASYQFEGVRA